MSDSFFSDSDEFDGDVYDEQSEDYPFEYLSGEARALYIDKEVPRIHKPSAFEFLRDYVSKNKPVIVTGLLDNWNISEWTNEFLRESMRGQEVLVECTPNGRADAIYQDKYFVHPETRKMEFDQFMDWLELENQSKSIGENNEKYRNFDGSISGAGDEILYVSNQNGNFFGEEAYEKLRSKIDQSVLSFAESAFGTEPDAVNIWIGAEKSVSSTHKDGYENMYCVIRGTKHFTLMPPTDYPWLYERPYTVAEYKPGQGPLQINSKYHIQVSDPPVTVPWISVDPDHPDLEKFPRFQKATVVKCSVRAGEVLYLPSLWYHQVSQTPDKDGALVAVNFWHDMQYDMKWNYYTFLRNVWSRHEKK